MGSRAGNTAQDEQATQAEETLTPNGTLSEFTASGGVTLIIRPYSLRFYREAERQALEAFPVPEAEADRERIEAERSQWLGERLLAYLLDFCVEVDLEPWETTIQRLERHLEPYPRDPFDRRVRFLTDYAVRTEGEYTEILTRSLKLAMGET